MNVVIDRAEATLGNAGRYLSRAASSIARREALKGEDIDALKRTIANVRNSLDEVEAEFNASRTGLTIPGATWDDRNAIAAERAAAKGVA